MMDYREVLKVGTVLDRKYRTDRVIGAGGFGITYLAHDLGLAAPVAVKEYYPAQFGMRDTSMSVRPRSDGDKALFDRLKASFLREARTLAQFDHQAIVRVLSVFEAHGTAYMVMRYESGPSLKAWLRSIERAPLQGELDTLLWPLLDAIELMHKNDFLHRDIAPDNIIVRSDGSPVLLDFGASRRVMNAMSGTLTGVVKQGYSPQEQYSSDVRAQGPWTDIYSLGATLYLAVTGQIPTEATARMLEDGMQSALDAAHGGYRPEFLAAIDAAMRLHPRDRPQSVADWRGMLFEGAYRDAYDDDLSPAGETLRARNIRVPATSPRTGGTSQPRQSQPRSSQPRSSHPGSSQPRPSQPHSTPRSGVSEREVSTPASRSGTRMAVPSSGAHDAARDPQSANGTASGPISAPPRSGSFATRAADLALSTQGAIVLGIGALLLGGSMLLAFEPGHRLDRPPVQVPSAAEIARQKAEADRLAEAARQKAEADRIAAAARQKTEADRLAEAARQKAEADRLAEAARQQAEADRLAEAARQKAEADRLAEAARQKAEADRIAEAARQKAEADRLAEAARQKAEADRIAAAARQKAEADRLAEAARQKAEADRLAEAARQKAEADRIAEAARQKAEADRLAEAARQQRVALATPTAPPAVTPPVATQPERQAPARQMPFAQGASESGVYAQRIAAAKDIVLAGGIGGQLRLWTTSTNRFVELPAKHDSAIGAIAISADQSRFATGSWGGEVRIWNGQTGALLHTITGPKAPIVAMHYRTETRVVAVDGTGIWWILDPTTGRVLMSSARSEPRRVTAASFSTDGRTFYVALVGNGSGANASGGDRFAIEAAMPTGENATRLEGRLLGHTDWIYAVAATPDGRTVVSASADGTVRLWDLAQSRERQRLTGHVGHVRALAVSPDGNAIAGASDDGAIIVWRIEDGREIARFNGPSQTPRDIAFHDAATVTVVGDDSMLRQWQIPAQRQGSADSGAVKQ